MTGKKQHIHPPPFRVVIFHANEGGGLDQGAIGGGAVEQLFGAGDERVAVGGGDLLDHDGGGLDGRDGVAAGAAVAEGVAVDFVEEVLLAVGVLEAGGVDDAAVAVVGRENVSF